ncbi:12575_t:CDS:1, partial [Cetraspora pellucida]
GSDFEFGNVSVSGSTNKRMKEVRFSSNAVGNNQSLFASWSSNKSLWSGDLD